MEKPESFSFPARQNNPFETPNKNIDFEENISAKPVMQDLRDFDPSAEVSKILKLTEQEEIDYPTPEARHELRKEKLASYREKLSGQQTHIAELSEYLEYDILPKLANGLISSNEVKQQITKDNSLTVDQKTKFEKVLSTTESALSNLNSFGVETEYLADSKIYARLFGRTPKGKIVITRRSLSLDVFCENTEDYEYAAKGYARSSKIFSKPSGNDTSIGRAKVPVLDDRLTSLVTLSRGEDVFDNDVVDTQIHEERHNIDYILEESIGEKISEDSGTEKVEVEKFNDELDAMEKRAKTEIFAHLKHNTLVDSIRSTLLATRALGGFYDYISSKEHVEKDEVGNYYESMRLQYQTEVGQAIDVVDTLRKLDLNPEEIIASLQHEELRNWYKVLFRNFKDKFSEEALLREQENVIMEEHEAKLSLENMNTEDEIDKLKQFVLQTKLNSSANIKRLLRRLADQ